MTGSSPVSDTSKRSAFVKIVLACRLKSISLHDLVMEIAAALKKLCFHSNVRRRPASRSLQRRWVPSKPSPRLVDYLPIVILCHAIFLFYFSLCRVRRTSANRHCGIRPDAKLGGPPQSKIYDIHLSNFWSALLLVVPHSQIRLFQPG